jgi:hypothetical protein
VTEGPKSIKSPAFSLKGRSRARRITLAPEPSGRRSSSSLSPRLSGSENSGFLSASGTIGYGLTQEPAISQRLETLIKFCERSNQENRTTTYVR